MQECRTTRIDRFLFHVAPTPPRGSPDLSNISIISRHTALCFRPRVAGNIRHVKASKSGCWYNVQMNLPNYERSNTFSNAFIFLFQCISYLIGSNGTEPDHRDRHLGKHLSTSMKITVAAGPALPGANAGYHPDANAGHDERNKICLAIMT